MEFKAYAENLQHQVLVKGYRRLGGTERPVVEELTCPLRVPLKVTLSLTIQALIFYGFWAQRPDYVRLLGYFDAKGL